MNLTDRIRRYARTMPLEHATRAAIADMYKENPRAMSDRIAELVLEGTPREQAIERAWREARCEDVPDADSDEIAARAVGYLEAGATDEQARAYALNDKKLGRPFVPPKEKPAVVRMRHDFIAARVAQGESHEAASAHAMRLIPFSAYTPSKPAASNGPTPDAKNFITQGYEAELNGLVDHFSLQGHPPAEAQRLARQEKARRDVQRSGRARSAGGR